ncbi:hypothetical protein [Aeromonas sp. Prich7-2]|uniref:hypothetical protein n=1 Tax=Aeromonas sp. Prich7-2 TaxID=2823361 RepID=UPI001B32E8EF|nr:hypothetical protein [Aeromonas sp. Prich7-2]MBP4060798.1 hypothetical protein [Aeromonas sp. Prich7-2]
MLKQFRLEILLAFPILIYPIFLDVYYSGLVYSDRFIYWFIQSIIFSIFMVVYYARLKNDLLEDVVLVTFIAAIITLMSFTIKPFEVFVTSIQTDPVFEIYSDFEHRYRAHGFSQHLNFSYGVLMGFMAGVCLFLGRIRMWYYLLIPFMLFASFVNARTGVIIFVIFLLLYMFSLLRTVRGSIVLSILVVFSLVLFVVLYSVNSDIFNSWYFAVFKDFFSFFSGAGEGTLSVIFGDFMIFPDDVLGLLLGTGESIYLRSFGNSDVGFILQVYYAGLLFTIYLYLYMFFCYWRVGAKVGYLGWFPLMFLMTFFLMNTKGFFFAGVPGVKVLFLLYAYFITSVRLYVNPTWRSYVSK